MKNTIRSAVVHQQRRTRLLPVMSGLLAAIALSLWASPAWADPILQAKHGDLVRGTLQRQADQFDLPKEQVGTNVSLHSGAQAGATGPNTTHAPANQPAGVSGRMPTRIIFENIGGFSSKKAVPTRNLPGNVPPATEPKNLKGNAHKTGLASAEDARVSSQAEATVKFTVDDKNVFIDSRGTFAKVTPKVKNPAKDGRDAAGALILDPMVYGPEPMGSIFSSILGLRKDDFQFDVDDSTGVAGSLTELGANLPEVSPGSLGKSFADDILLYRLVMSFTADSDIPLVDFNSNRDGIGFFIPGTSTLLSDDDIESRVASNVMRISNTNTWVLKNDIDLFELSTVLRADVANFQFDYAHGVIAATVPEPSTLLLIGFIGICALPYGWRRQRANTKRALRHGQHRTGFHPGSLSTPNAEAT